MVVGCRVDVGTELGLQGRWGSCDEIWTVEQQEADSSKRGRAHGANVVEVECAALVLVLSDLRTAHNARMDDRVPRPGPGKSAA